jgi:hypothetical protein
MSDTRRATQAAFVAILRPGLLNLANAPYGQSTRQRKQLLLQALTTALLAATPRLVQLHQHRVTGQFGQIHAQEDVQTIPPSFLLLPSCMRPRWTFLMGAPLNLIWSATLIC